MTRIRHLYVYGVAAVSLLFLATGLENLVRLLIQTAGGVEATGWLWLNRGNLRDQVSFFVALAVISGPVWVGHWVWASREQLTRTEASGIRRFYLYLVLAGSLLFFVPGAIGLLRIPLWTLLRAPLSQPVASALGAPIGLLVVTVPIYLYHCRLALAEGTAAGATSRLETIRRLYDYLATFVAVNLFLINLARLATSFWEGALRLAHGDVAGDWTWASLALPSYGVAALVLLGVWWWHWQQAEVIARADGPGGQSERRSLLRRLTLYGLVLVCVVVTVVNLTTLLEYLFRAVLGSPDPTGTGRSLLDAAGQPLLWGLSYGAFWIYAGWWLRREASRAPEADEQAALRRLYYYLVAAVGLAVLATGLITLVDTLLSLPGLTPAQAAAGWLRDRVSQEATHVLVGGPLWLGHWLHQQKLAAIPSRASAERGSRWRRLYLYAILFACVVAILIDAASALYQLLLAVLGGTAIRSLLESTRAPLSVILVASIFLYYHWRALRSDLATTVESPPPPEAAVAAILVRALTPEQLERTLAMLASYAADGVDLTVAREPRIERQIKEQLDDWRARKFDGDHSA